MNTNRLSLIPMMLFATTLVQAQGVKSSENHVQQQTTQGRLPEQSAGSLEGHRYPQEMYAVDTAFTVIMLTLGQSERISAMDKRYADRLFELGEVTTDDPRFRALWDSRRKEIKSILTTSQFKRWQELNGELVDGGATPAPQKLEQMDK